MAEDDQIPKTRTNGATWADVAIHIVDAVRDIFNDWRVWVIIAVVVLMSFGKLAGPEVADAVERWIHAWRGTG